MRKERTITDRIRPDNVDMDLTEAAGERLKASVWMQAIGRRQDFHTCSDRISGPVQVHIIQRHGLWLDSPGQKCIAH